MEIEKKSWDSISWHVKKKKKNSRAFPALSIAGGRFLFCFFFFFYLEYLLALLVQETNW